MKMIFEPEYYRVITYRAFMQGSRSAFRQKRPLLRVCRCAYLYCVTVRVNICVCVGALVAVAVTITL
jgi:hypothetical protein